MSKAITTLTVDSFDFKNIIETRKFTTSNGECIVVEYKSALSEKMIEIDNARRGAKATAAGAVYFMQVPKAAKIYAPVYLGGFHVDHITKAATVVFSKSHNANGKELEIYESIAGKPFFPDSKPKDSKPEKSQHAPIDKWLPMLQNNRKITKYEKLRGQKLLTVGMVKAIPPPLCSGWNEG